MLLKRFVKSFNNISANDQIRRIVDIAAAGVGLFICLPLFIVIAVAVKLTSPGPVLHRAQRVGQFGRLFWLYKFRSMVADAAQRGPGITAKDDRRVTSLGRWLRRYKLDELPQLMNVLNGDMSLVGPRPEDPRYVEHYTTEQQLILMERPGITSPASLRYRDEEQLLNGPDWETLYQTVILPDKLEIELNYIEHRSILSDIQIIIRTALSLIHK